MINWLYQTGLDISILIGIVLVLRYPVRKYLGANVAYWLWLIPLVRLLVWKKAEVPIAILEKINLSGGSIAIKVFKNPENYNLSSYLTWQTLWMLGVLIWLSIRIIGLIKFKKSLALSRVKVSNQEIYQLVAHKKIQLFYTDNPSAPFVTGLFQAQIYLPKKQFEHLTKQQQLYVIKHELTHIQRKDLWMQLIAEVVRTLFWFNPIVHIAWKAFRQDQELACDFKVLAQCSKQQRYEYGRILLNGLHAHALPATMAFFNNHKQRFIMLEKHNNSKLNTILGITLCSFLLVFALTKAPQSIATEPTKDMEVSFKFDEIPLKSILELIFDANPKEVTGYENVPDINISFEAWNVSAIQIQNLILKCSGLVLIPQDNKFKIVKDKSFGGNYSQINECVQI